MFFNKKERIGIINQTEGDIKKVELYKNRDFTFLLVCDVKKSKGTIGINNNYCISILTGNGFVPLVDNRTLNIPEVSLEDDVEVTLSRIEQGFFTFISFADKL